MNRIGKMGSKLLTAAVLALTLSACGSFDALQGRVAERGSMFWDETLETAEFTQCRGASVGAVARRYWQDADRREAWATLCSTADDIVPPQPGTFNPLTGEVE